MTRDMYGHLIHVTDNDGAGGFGVSVTWERRAPDGPRTPMFTFFHESDDFRQSLFSVHFEHVEGPLGGGRAPRVSDIFHDRVTGVLDLLKEERNVHEVQADLNDLKSVAAATQPAVIQVVEALGALVLPLREWLESNADDTPTVERIEATTTALRAGLAAYDRITGREAKRARHAAREGAAG